MAERHRLGDLQMGETGHHRVGMRLGPVDQGRLQSRSAASSGRSRRAPTAGIGRDLVVARARRMQPPGRRPISSARRASMLRWMSSFAR
jgi:hypothetical protein